MSRFLLDSGPASDFINGRQGIRPRVAAAKGRGNIVGIAYPVLGELLGGAERAASPDRQVKLILREVAHLKLWPFTLVAVREYGRLFGFLSRLGRPMQQIDIQIAAIALAMGNTTVVTYDSDLSAVPSLSVENWLKTP